MKNVKQLLPKGSREIIIKALKTYQHSLDIIGNGFDDTLNNEHFDCYGLIGMMNYDVEITLPKNDVENFGQYNVDFPMFGEVKRKYLTNEESEWVTIIKGDFSFVDDGVHGRECYVNSIASITKHLRVHMNRVIDEIENDGFGYVVVEDYDGSIEMNVEDKREYLIVNSMVESVRRQTYAEMKETDGDIMDRIDLIEVGETGARNDGEVYYIRVE
tara:strand:+ start:7170 stop:7814 length:645 start_codon:yes stop_codon:yes gene_type:complete